MGLDKKKAIEREISRIPNFNNKRFERPIDFYSPLQPKLAGRILLLLLVFFFLLSVVRDKRLREDE